MAKKNWFDGIQDRVSDASFDEFNLPVFKSGMNLAKTLLTDPFDLDNVHMHVAPVEDLLADLEKSGFKDKGDYYEMVTGLGGYGVDGGVPEDAVKVELLGAKDNIVEITYEHQISDGEHSFCRHAQKTSVTLPADADNKTVKAEFDDENNVVVTVKKKVAQEPAKRSREIPIGTRTKKE